jgi:hypothetical protein
VAAMAPAAPMPALEPVHVRGVELRAVLGRLREQAVTQVEQVRASFATMNELAQQSTELRERCQETRASHRRRPDLTAP